MTNYKEILRLISLGYTQRQIAASIHCSRDTVRNVAYVANSAGITWPIDKSVTDEELRAIFNPKKQNEESQYVEPDYAYIHRELARKGVNLSLLWDEYCTKCYSMDKSPYMYTQFCNKYRKWARTTKATMRIKHKPGDAMQVDWAGATIDIVDAAGLEMKAYMFVAVLPCSGYTYAEACRDMTQDTWIRCHINAYEYFGGSTRLLIPDNLKTGVTENSRYETRINRSYQEMAEYYSTAIVPARVRHPQDKGMVEGSVKYVSTWIIAALRDRRFFTYDEAYAAVAEKLEELNARAFSKGEGNRRSAFYDEELAFMTPLPHATYEPAVWSTAKVHLDYLISDGKNKYSVPFDLIGETVDIRLTYDMVEVFFKGSKVAVHKRSREILREPVVTPGHMPEMHRKYLKYNSEDFLMWAKSVGRSTTAVVTRFLDAGREPEQGYKSCVSLTKLGIRYGNEALELACERVLSYAVTPSIRIISTALKAGQNSQPSEPLQNGEEHYGITRGAAYFAKEETDNE